MLDKNMLDQEHVKKNDHLINPELRLHYVHVIVKIEYDIVSSLYHSSKE